VGAAKFLLVPPITLHQPKATALRQPATSRRTPHTYNYSPL
jgi:hypothetical protein